MDLEAYYNQKMEEVFGSISLVNKNERVL